MTSDEESNLFNQLESEEDEEYTDSDHS